MQLLKKRLLLLLLLNFQHFLVGIPTLCMSKSCIAMLVESFWVRIYVGISNHHDLIGVKEILSMHQQLLSNNSKIKADS